VPVGEGEDVATHGQRYRHISKFLPACRRLRRIDYRCGQIVLRWVWIGVYQAVA